MFFSSWSSLLRLLVVGVSAYFALVLLLRVSGKRTLAKLNAFDLVVTVAFGSTLASALLSKDVTFVDVAAAMLLLVLLQLAITWSSMRSRVFERIVKADPSLLFYEGRYFEAAMHRERISKEEVLAAIRSAGHADPDGVAAVVLETDGTLSVLTEGSTSREALRTVRGAPPLGPPGHEQSRSLT